MKSSTGKMILVGCSGLGLVFLLAAGAAIWFVFGAIDNTFQNTARGYAVRDGKVVFKTGLGGFSMPQSLDVEDADVATFKNLDDDYGRDKNHGYVDGFMIPGSDGASFEVIAKHYAKDRSRVFYDRGVLSDAPATFKILINDTAKYFATDGAKVFYGGNAIFPETLDAATFERIEDTNFYKDKNHVYLIYNRQEIIEAADPKTFKLVPGYSDTYATDKASVYYDGEKVPNCDVKTHEILNWYAHRDSRRVFYRTKKISDDAADFRTLDDSYSKDKNTVWLLDEIVPNADAATFEIYKSDEYDARDKNNYYKYGKAVAPRK